MMSVSSKDFLQFKFAAFRPAKKKEEKEKIFENVSFGLSNYNHR
jgi:hypothetical protein